jgi:gluconokinase
VLGRKLSTPRGDRTGGGPERLCGCQAADRVRGSWYIVDVTVRRPFSLLIVMGVAGSGKTVVGQRLAEKLGLPFLDADTLHAPESVAKMARGEPLDDADREPWIARLESVVRERAAIGEGLVLAWSALRTSHRERVMRAAGAGRVVVLDVSERELRRRLQERKGHFFGPELLDSQLASLEMAGDAIVVDGERPVEAIVDEVIASTVTG